MPEPLSTDKSLGADLFACGVMEMFRKALAAHDCLAQAYLERTSLMLEAGSEYTLADMRRASRLLRAHYDRDAREIIR